MTIIASDFFRLRTAQLIRTSLLGGPLTPISWRLFVNNIEPTAETQLSDFVEASFDGYTPKSNPTWQLPVAVGTAYVTVAAGFIFWGGNGPPSQNLYGWYSVFEGSGGPLLMLSERFDNAPIVFPISLGAGITVLPSVSQRSQFGN